MYSEVQSFWFVGLSLWLGVVSFFIWKQRKDQKESLEGSKSGFLRLKSDAGLQKAIQRVSLIRYNPYQDTGGDQSFSIALLDQKGDGVVLTSLHSRSGTRVFAKQVLMGKEEKTQFSEEERKVIEEALQNK